MILTPENSSRAFRFTRNLFTARTGASARPPRPFRRFSLNSRNSKLERRNLSKIARRFFCQRGLKKAKVIVSSSNLRDTGNVYSRYMEIRVARKQFAAKKYRLRCRGSEPAKENRRFGGAKLPEP